MTKQLLYRLGFLIAGLIPAVVIAQVKIGGLPASPHPAALLELEANNRGLLLPRLNTAEWLAVPADAQSKGLMVYNTDSNKIFTYDGTNWRPLMYSSPVSYWQLGGNTGISPASKFIGTTDSVDFVVRTNNQQRFTVKANGLTGIGTDDPISALDVLNNGRSDGADDINIRSYNNTGGPALLLSRAKGTLAAPVNLQNNDFLGILAFSGQVNGANASLSSIIANYTGNGTTALSSLSFRTSGNQGMFLNDKGWLTIGNNSASAGATADVQGSLRYKLTYLNTSTSYTISNTDLVVLVTEGIGPSTIVLPDAAEFDGHMVIVKNNKLTAVSLSGTLLCNGGGTSCSTLAAQRVIGLVGQFVGGNMNWVQIF